jgi:hypothetical protein
MSGTLKLCSQLYVRENVSTNVKNILNLMGGRVSRIVSKIKLRCSEGFSVREREREPRH